MKKFITLLSLFFVLPVVLATGTNNVTTDFEDGTNQSWSSYGNLNSILVSPSALNGAWSLYFTADAAPLGTGVYYQINQSIPIDNHLFFNAILDFRDNYGRLLYANSTNPVIGDVDTIIFYDSGLGYRFRNYTGNYNNLVGCVGKTVNISIEFDNDYFYSLKCNGTTVLTNHKRYQFNLTNYDYVILTAGTTGVGGNKLKFDDVELYQEPPTVNLTFYDEKTRQGINNVSYELYIGNTAVLANTTTGTTNLEINDTGILEIVYNSDGYYLRRYFLNITSESNEDINLYLLNSSLTNADEISYSITDQSGVNLDGALISVLRRYSINDVTTYETVEMSESNLNGEGYLHLEKYDATYLFSVEYEGDTILITGDNVLSKDSIVLKGTVGDRVTEGLYDLYGITYSLSYANFNHTLVWSDSEGNLENICITTYRYLATGKITTNSSCSTSTAGTIILGIGGTTGNYETVVIATIGGEEYVLVTDTRNLNDVGTNIGIEGLFWIIILVVVVGFMGSFSPVTAVLLTVFSLIMATIMGIASFTMGGLMFLACIAGFIIYSLRKKGGGNE